MNPDTALTPAQPSPSRAPAMRQEQAQIVRQISGLGEISDRYDAILCDIWGVLHNGVASFALASAALASFRRRGGAVVLITNAPRPSLPIRQQVLQLGVPPEAFDAIVTSGDVTIGLMEDQPGDRVLHIGPGRDLSLFDAAAEATGGRLRLVALEDSRICALHRSQKRRERNAR